MNDTGVARRECPYNGCGWHIEVEKDWPEDEIAREDADHQAEMHFEREHGGRAKVRVVLEKEVFAHPGRELQDILDETHDEIEDKAPAGWDVAFAYGEFLKTPEGLEIENTEGRTEETE